MHRCNTWCGNIIQNSNTQKASHISQVPPRRRHVPTLRKIDYLNSILVSKCDPRNKILCIQPCPSMPAYFQWDNGHFKKRGVDMFAKKSKSLVNFSMHNVREDMWLEICMEYPLNAWMLSSTALLSGVNTKYISQWFLVFFGELLWLPASPKCPQLPNNYWCTIWNWKFCKITLSFPAVCDRGVACKLDARG